MYLEATIDFIRLIIGVMKYTCVNQYFYCINICDIILLVFRRKEKYESRNDVNKRTFYEPDVSSQDNLQFKVIFELYRLHFFFTSR